MTKWHISREELNIVSDRQHRDMVEDEMDILNFKRHCEKQQREDPRDPSWMGWFDLRLDTQEFGPLHQRN